MEDIFGRGYDYSRLEGKTVLVTGAYGMLASYLVYFLIWLNEIKGFNINIVSLSRSADKLYTRFGEYAERPYFENVTDDINKPLNIGGNADFIIHAASLASPGHYESRPREVALPNIFGTYNLLELAVQKKSEAFLFYSTGAVYGKTDKPYVAETDFGCIDPLNIHSCYDESKRMGETLCKIYEHQFAVNAKIARFSHTYGPTMDIDNDSRVFAEFVRNAVRGEDIVMKSDGQAKRAFCYISDATAGILKILMDGTPGEAYNVSNIREISSISDLAETIGKIGNSRVVRKERQEREGGYLEAPFSGIGDNAKLKSLGWECRHDIKDGFSRTIQSFKIRKGS